MLRIVKLAVPALFFMLLPLPILAASDGQEQLDTLMASELGTALHEIWTPIAPLTASALKKASPSPELDDIDKKLLDFPPQDLTDVTDITSNRFEGQKRIHQVMVDAYKAHGGGRAGEFAASQAAGMQALAETMKQENMRREKGRKRQGVIRFRVDYKQGAWALAMEQIAQDPGDQVLMARAIRKTIESNPAQVSDEKREDSVLAYAAALANTSLLPFAKRQLLRIFDESQTWYDASMATVADAKKKRKIAERNLAGCLAFLQTNIESLNAGEAENIAKHLVASAILAGDKGLYDDMVYSLEHQTGREAEGAFMVAGLLQEAWGNKAQALDVYRAYLEDYAGFNLAYKAKAKFSGWMTRKVEALSGADAKPHTNRNWGVRAEDMAKAAQERKLDKKREDSGLEWN